MLTLVSPLLNLVSSQAAGSVPKRSHIAWARSGCELPEKTLTCLISKRALSTLDFHEWRKAKAYKATISRMHDGSHLWGVKI